VLKPGRRIVYGEVHVYSGEKLVAHATLSFLNTPLDELGKRSGHEGDA
jgi:acyl-coenzyme A thioesterase PaaI-like protein